MKYSVSENKKPVDLIFNLLLTTGKTVHFFCFVWQQGKLSAVAGRLPASSSNNLAVSFFQNDLLQVFVVGHVRDDDLVAGLHLIP